MISEHVANIKTGKITAEEYIMKIIDEAINCDEEYHYFSAFSGTLAIAQAKQLDKKILDNSFDTKKLPLAGVPITVKANICIKDIETTAGSAILKGYKPLYNATAVQRLIDAGGIIIGHTAQDEFGFGSFGANVGNEYPIPKNPIDPSRVCGGSSAGAGGWTRKTIHEHAALCESTGGSIAAPASFCGIVGFCPTYGRVSRYGLIDYANSLDKIGSMTKITADTALILNSIAGADIHDSTSANNPVPDYTAALGKGVQGITIGVVKQALGEGVQQEVANSCQNALEQLEHAGARLQEIELPTTLTYGLPAYYILAMSEASTNLAKYCGMRYGIQDIKNEHYNDYFTRIRTTHLGKEAKRRILLGTFARMAGHRDAYYLKAAQARTLIIKEYQRLFAHVNMIATPTMPFIAPKFKEIQELTPLQNYLADVFTVGPNISGMPHINMPVGKSQGMPVGLMLTANHFQESILIQTGDTLEHTKNRT